MTKRYTHAADPRRTAMTERLRRLKGIAVAGSAVAALGFWSLVSGAVAAASTPAPTAVAQPIVRTSSGSAFFGGGSSLGSGTSYAPVTRSRGS
jgi:hypothetical protein